MTEEQLTTRNRENASHSTGPKSIAGKRRACLNASRHSLTGQIVCATPEELAVFNKFCDEIRAELAPAGAIETFLATSISEDMWRLQRARALENGVFANGHRERVDQINAGHPEVDTSLAQSQTWTDEAHNLALLTVYEGRIRRTLEKNTAQLKALQSERKFAHAQACEQARILMQLSEGMGLQYEPANDFLPASDWGGFVFSAAEMNRRREREARLKLARDYDRTGELPIDELEAA